MGTTLTATFETRREAEMTVERLVQEHGLNRADIFIASSPDKVARLKPLVGDAVIEVDGGVDTATADSVASAGASLFVAGSAVFGAADPAAAYAAIAAAAKAS